MPKSYVREHLQFGHLLGGDTHTYAPVKTCIYCGRERYSEERMELSKEHIIPYSFGGKLVLRQSSCKACADVTSAAERVCSKELFFHARTHLNLPTYRPKERPESLITGFTENEKTIIKSVPLSSHPFVFSMPHFQRAGILAGRPRETQFDNVTNRIQCYFPPGLLPASSVGVKTPNFAIEVKLNDWVIALVIAKIAHSFAVAELGIDYFYPALPEFILGISKSVPYIVGCMQGKPQADPTKLHRLFLRELRIGKTLYLVCYIKLFGKITFPTYEVVVGRVKGLRRRPKNFIRERSQPYYKPIPKPR